MTKNYNFQKAYVEILEMLKYIIEDDLKKIPKSEIEFFERNKDKEYVFKYNENLDFEEQAILPETHALILKLYKDYFWKK